MLRIVHLYQPIWLYRPLLIGFNVLAIVHPIYLLYRQFARAAALNITFPLTSIIILVIMAVLEMACALVAGNFFVEITSNEAGLQVPFLWMRLNVPWSALEAVRPSFWSLPIGNRFYVVRTKALTPFHRLYGLIYAFSLDPSFIYSDSISDSAELGRRIRAHLKPAQK